MAKSNRDNLIRTFLSKNRRSVPVDQFPRNPNPNGRPAFRPVKQNTPQPKPRKRSSY